MHRAGLGRRILPGCLVLGTGMTAVGVHGLRQQQDREREELEQAPVHGISLVASAAACNGPASRMVPAEGVEPPT